MDNLYLGNHAYYSLAGALAPRSTARGMAFGLPVHTSNAFPYTAKCKACDGTGEGEASTYCPKCKGAGSIKYEGMMQSAGQTILLTSPLPKLFEPSFPSGLVPMPKLSRGLV